MIAPSVLVLKLEAEGGGTIYEACREAVGVANALRIMVEFEFNGVTVVAKPFVSPQKLAAA